MNGRIFLLDGGPKNPTPRVGQSRRGAICACCAGDQTTSHSGGGTGAAGAEAAGGPRRTAAEGAEAAGGPRRTAAAEGAEEAPRSSRRGGGGGDLRDADRVRRGRFRSGRGRRAPPRGLSCCCSLHHLIFFPALWALRVERETRNGFLTPIFRIFQTRWFCSARAWRDVLNAPYPNGQKKSRRALTRRKPLFRFPSEWWRRRDSNSRPPRCERDALPTELLPRGGKRGIV